MTEGIGETSLTMGAPWHVVVGCLVHISRSGSRGPLYELIGSGDEDCDPRRREAGLSRAALLPLSATLRFDWPPCLAAMAAGSAPMVRGERA